MVGHKQREPHRVERAKPTAAEHFFILEKTDDELSVALLSLLGFNFPKRKALNPQIERVERAFEYGYDVKFIPPFSEHYRHIVGIVLRIFVSCLTVLKEIFKLSQVHTVHAPAFSYLSIFQPKGVSQ